MLHWQGLLAVLALAGGWVPAVGNPAELLTFVAVVAIAVIVGWRGPGRLAPVVGARVLRERAERSAFLRTRDPDAAGRVRPRAPGQRAV